MCTALLFCSSSLFSSLSICIVFLSLSLSSHNKINTSAMLFNNSLLPLSPSNKQVNATHFSSLSALLFFCLSQSNLNQPFSHTCTSLWPGVLAAFYVNTRFLSRQTAFCSLSLLLEMIQVTNWCDHSCHCMRKNKRWHCKSIEKWESRDETVE